MAVKQVKSKNCAVVKDGENAERPYPYLGYLFTETANSFRRETSIALSPLELTPRLFGTFDQIARCEPLSQRTLGDLRRIDRTTIVAQVDHLEKLGLIRREDNPNDRREYALVTTDKGREVLTLARDAVRATEDKVLAQLEPNDRAKFFEILLRLFQLQINNEE